MANVFKTVSPGTAPYASDMDQFRQVLSGIADVGPLSLAPIIAAPSAPTLSIGSAGVLNGTYTYALVAITGWKENSGNVWVGGFAPGTEASKSAANQQIIVTIPTFTAPIMGYAVYRTAVGGASGTEKFVGVVTASGINFTDSVTDANRGTGMPSWSGDAIPASIPTTNTTGTYYPVDFLMGDIKGTIQTPTFVSGKIIQIVHKVGTTVIRTDTFTYSQPLITEVRTLISGDTLTLKYYFNSDNSFNRTEVS